VRFTPSTAAERSPSFNPWESRPHIRASAVTASVGGRWVVAASAHPRSGDGGLGVALAKAVLFLSNACAESGKVPANEVVPAVRKHPGTVANTCVGGASDG
jgi:hypothetical protein